MEKSETIIVIIEDNNSLRDEPFIVEAELIFEKVIFFDDSKDGLDFIQMNIDKRMVVLLDLSFPQNLPDGHEILEKIREWSFLVPVIIWSGKDEDKETFSDLINNKAFSYLKKSASNEEIINELRKAENYIQTSIDKALEEWISAHSEEQRERPYMVTIDGTQLTLNDMLTEIRKQSPIGKHFSKNLVKLSIDLVSRNKERLND